MFHPCRSPQRPHWCNGSSVEQVGSMQVHRGKKVISWEISILAVMSVLGSDYYKVSAAVPNIINLRILHQIQPVKSFTQCSR